MLTDSELQSLRNTGNESETAANEITKLRAELAKVTWQRNEAQADLAASQVECERLRRGEYICKQCGLRKDAESGESRHEF